MIKRIVGWFVLVPLCAILIVFALANRHAVPVRFDPVSPGSPLIADVNTPLFIVIYGMLILGVLLGGFAAWLAQGRVRRERRRFKRENDRLTRELAEARRAPRQNATDRALLGPDDLLEDE
ncbi:LapA family protein [Mariluticola halotolerans]|uniref:LapA family protein n=1 Tax=Mariluticola halotolerans TaxID=2909283 RepID=UPI0026E30274|nr:LapA family protein [Mariluticola halotolerans]UJQ93312.1 LapA family protein [Mariluticola halotolerans]